MLTSAVRDGDDALVAYSNDNDPSPDPTWRVRRVGMDGSLPSPSSVALTRGRMLSYGGLSLANGPLGRAGVAWDEVNGCRFVPLGADGTPSASAHGVGDGWCFWLHETRAGYSFFAGEFAVPPIAAVMLNTRGELVGMTPPLTPRGPGVYPAGRAWFDDSTFLFAWYQDVQVVARHFDGGGGGIASATLITQNTTGGIRATLSSLGDSAMSAWVDPETGSVAVAALDEDGGASVPSVVGTATGSTVIASARSGDGALIGWAFPDRDGVYRLHLLNVTAAGTPGAAADASLLLFVSSLAMVLTPAGGLAIFTGENGAAPQQVFALPLVCQ
jgi:hypothetical protein